MRPLTRSQIIKHDVIDMDQCEHSESRFRILRVIQKSIKWPWAGPFEMNVKIEQELNFVIQNDSRLFFDAQEA